MEMSLKQKLFYFFPVLFCFCLPFGSLTLSVIIAFWTIASFFNLDKTQLKNGFLNKNAWLLLLFYLSTILSAIFSKNKTEAFSAMEVKMSFFFFPYLMFCFKWPIDILRRCVISFVSGCFFACLYLIGRAFVFSMNGQPEYFFYTLFSDLIHASYFAMYLILAIVFVVMFYHDWFKSQRSVIYSSYFFVSVFVTSIFLCSSKLGLISFFITMPILVAYRWRHLLTTTRSILLLVALVMVVFISAKVFPGTFARMNSLSNVSLGNLDKTSSESTTVRVLIWEQSVNIIRSNFILGTGVGDANDTLYESYRENGLTGAYTHHFNAHNQFFQSFIGLGIIGFLLLLMLTIGQVIKGLVKRNFLLFLFSLIIVLNFFVESMLQTSAGVLFFAFFYCFFNLISETELRGQPAQE